MQNYTRSKNKKQKGRSMLKIIKFVMVMEVDTTQAASEDTNSLCISLLEGRTIFISNIGERKT